MQLAHYHVHFLIISIPYNKYFNFTQVAEAQLQDAEVVELPSTVELQLTVTVIEKKFPRYREPI